jgi:hypothetical protein
MAQVKSIGNPFSAFLVKPWPAACHPFFLSLARSAYV